MKYLLFLLGCMVASVGLAQDLEQLKNSKPISFQGSLTSGFQAYRVNGIDPRSNNPQWVISGQATVSIYSFAVPLSFTIGRQGNNVQYPAFKQFGASPKWRWITVHGGWRNLNFSPYTLAGHSFLGGGLELNPGKFRFGAMAGTFRQAREGKNAESGSFSSVFKRTGYAVKIGLGSSRTFFDLIYLRAKDDANSIKKLPSDSLLTPAENAVIGYATRLQFGRHVSFYSEGAVSMYTRNQLSIAATDSSLFPEVPFPITPRFSSRLNYAAKAGLDFNFSHFGIKTGYERILPNFETMGAYYFNNDIENITVSPNFSFAKQKGRLFGTLGLQRNNLLGNRSETTNRVIGNAGFSYNPTQVFGLEANYLNASVKQDNSRAELNDTVRIAIVNTNIGLTPHWNWVDSLGSFGLVLAANYQQLNDRNPFTREFANMNTVYVSANLNKNYTAGSWGWLAGINLNTIKVYALKSTRYGGTLGLNKNWLDGATTASLSTTWNASNVGGKNDGSVFSTNLNFNWTIAEVYTFSLYASYLYNYSKAFENYSEWQGGATITRVFRRQDKKNDTKK